MELMDHQIEAISKLGNGKILYGGVGSGKTAAVLGYYVAHESPKHIYVITTARKRDSLDWEGEAAKFGISTEDHLTMHGIITVDSWNQIRHYEGIKDAFFVFDEQRLVGSGAWTKSFIKIARANGTKHDDLLELVRIERLRGQIGAAGLRIVDEDLYVTGTFRRLPAALTRWLRDSPLTQDIVIGHVQYLLAKD